MTELGLQAVFLPVALSIILCLIPRLPWSVESSLRIEVWSAAQALTFATILSLFIIEGAEIWLLTQRWYSLWITAVILALGGAASCGFVRKLWKPSSKSPMSGRLFLLTGTSAFAIFILGFPFYDGILARIILAAIAALATLLMIPISGRTPVATPFTFSISFGTIAVLLVVSGSLKVALIASSLSLTSGICALLAFWYRGFSGGASFAMAGITLAFALALYGASYHHHPEVTIVSWCVASLAPLLLCVAHHSRFRNSTRIALVVILITCGAIAFVALRAAQTRSQASDNCTPYTSKNDERTFPYYPASSI